MTTVTDNQLILAAVAGSAGIFATFIPMFVVTVAYIKKNSNSANGLSIWSFLIVMMGIQFLVSLGFYWGSQMFDAVIKFKDMQLMGSGGAFELFWRVPIIEASPLSQNITYTIEAIRSWVATVNAFAAPLFIMVGVSLAMTSSGGIFQGGRSGDSAMDDMVGFVVKLFLHVLIAAFVYTGWAKMGAYTMMIPSPDGGNATLIEASQQWWRQAFGINGGKSADLIRF